MIHDRPPTDAPQTGDQLALEAGTTQAGFYTTLANVDAMLTGDEGPSDDSWLTGKDASGAVISDKEPEKPGFLRTASDLLASERGLDRMPTGTDPYGSLRDHHNAIVERRRLQEEKYRRHLAKFGIQDRLGITLATEPLVAAPSEDATSDDKPRLTSDQVRQMMADETNAWIESDGWQHGDDPIRGMSMEEYAAAHGFIVS